MYISKNSVQRAKETIVTHEESVLVDWTIDGIYGCQKAEKKYDGWILLEISEVAMLKEELNSSNKTWK